MHGNCQAESLRLMLDGGDLQTVRIPPVHEMTPDDVVTLRRRLADTDVLISQPVRDGYRGLPVGTAELATALPARARVVRVPVIRCAGLYPRQAIIRPPSDTSLVPPVVAYHDLGTLAEAAGRPGRPRLDAAAVRAIHADSLAALREREARHGTVVVSDRLERPTFADMRTLNHPGNPLLATLAERVREAAGLPPRPVDPGRPLLNSVHAPREPAVLEAFGLAGEPRPHWLVEGAPVDTETVRAAHLSWYAEHPDAVTAGLARHAAALEHLGL